MSNVLTPIPTGVVKKHDRIQEKRRNISSWFLDEYMIVDFGDYVGRPNGRITLQNEYLTRFLENGWKIDKILSTTESGIWGASKTSQTNTSTAENTVGATDNTSSSSTSGSSDTSTNSTQTTKGSSTTNSGSSSSGNSSNSSQSADSNYSSSGSGSGTGSSKVSNSGSSSSQSESSAQNSATSTSSSSDTTTSSHTGRSESTDTSGFTRNMQDSLGTKTENTSENESGPAFWASIQRVQLVRRRMQPELVLQDMVDSYVTQFNRGITNEDSRFNELVTLYGVMLNRNETEGNAIVNDALDVTALFNSLRSSIDTTWNAAHNSAIDLKVVAGEGAENEIRLEYEALISKTRSQMIGQGTYNGTVWPTVEAGLRRQMEAAIVQAKAKGMAEATTALKGVLDSKGDVMAQLVNAKNAIAAAIDQRKITVIELRNTVLKAMLDFIGSREDVYPQLQEISQLAQNIGFTVGAAGNVL